jgi:hypothetical protein
LAQSLRAYGKFCDRPVRHRCASREISPSGHEIDKQKAYANAAFLGESGLCRWKTQLLNRNVARLSQLEGAESV